MDRVRAVLKTEQMSQIQRMFRNIVEKTSIWQLTECGGGKTRIIEMVLFLLFFNNMITHFVIIAKPGILSGPWKDEMRLIMTAFDMNPPPVIKFWKQVDKCAALEVFVKEGGLLMCSEASMKNFAVEPNHFCQELHILKKARFLVAFDEIQNVRNSTKKKWMGFKNVCEEACLKFLQTGTPYNENDKNLEVQLYCLTGRRIVVDWVNWERFRSLLEPFRFRLRSNRFKDAL